MNDLVIRIFPDTGPAVKEIRIPLEELPANHNVAQPLRLWVGLEPRKITQVLFDSPLPTWPATR